MRNIFAAGAMIAACLLSWAAPVAASAQTRVDLTSGFQPDPWSTTIELRGRSGSPPRTTDENGVACIGGFDWVDVEVEFTAANLGLPLHISVGSAVDTTLTVEDPYGDFYCDDDSGAFGYNPLISIQTPRSGRYRIWVGVYRDPQTQQIPAYEYGSRAWVSISEMYTQ